MNQQDPQQDRDQLQHYLRTLRKKVDHQLKNPFQYLFANYTFDELATWKNNVLQLDATSRLYGQRVDFLHSGAMQILGSVLSNEGRKSDGETKTEIKKQQAYDNLPHQKNLQDCQKLNCTISKLQANILLWREICKKRDALHQLMLNDFTLENGLTLGFLPYSSGQAPLQEQNREDLVYLKLVDFKGLAMKPLQIYKQIEQSISEFNLFMVSFKGKERVRDRQTFENFMDFDLSSFNIDQMADLAPQQSNDPLIKSQGHSFQLQFQPIEQFSDKEEVESDGDYQYSEDYFQFEEWNRNEKIVKNKPRKLRSKDAYNASKKQQFIFFQGIHPFKSQILQSQNEQQQNEKYLNPIDYLHLRFCKYISLFPKRQKRPIKSKLKLILPNPVQEFSGQPINLDQRISYEYETANPNMTTNLSRFSLSKTNFKEAALSIKVMKTKIKDQIVSSQYQQVKFQEIKTFLANEQPLDVFISLLHVAAEHQILLSI